jgi:YD repeat-containing protein
LLTGVTDEKNVRFADYKYNCDAKGISTEHNGGVDKALLSYNPDGSTTVTNSLGKNTIYRFSTIAGARRITKVEGQPTANCAGANQDYTYTTEGWVASKTDWKGIKTTYVYNSLGQETSRTEAFNTPEAKTITTEWHSTLYLKTKETEPGREILYSYDANGNLLSQTVNSLTTP